jgi:predicted amidohydrolase YtcJ
MAHRVINLDGRFVVPPFGEAHNHNLVWNGEEDFARLRRMYLGDGIFYVKNPNPTNLRVARAGLQGRINIPSGLDVVFSSGGLSSTGGHPAEIVRRNIQRGGMTEADGEGIFYHAVDSLADLERKWPRILAGRPDFIKTVLVHSEDYEARRTSDEFFGKRGLNPALMPAIVRRAHAAGLPVTAHIETAADFRVAVRAGVNELAHMPGFAANEQYPMSRFALVDGDARAAARARVTVVTTLGEAADGIFGEGMTVREHRPIHDMLVGNLRLLARHGIPLAIGSDEWGETSAPEAMKLRKFGVFDNRALLKMWCETTAKAIFPRRRIGHLRPGFEASFLVLRGNPIRNFEEVRSIDLRIKQGIMLTV